MTSLRAIEPKDANDLFIRFRKINREYFSSVFTEEDYDLLPIISGSKSKSKSKDKNVTDNNRFNYPPRLPAITNQNAMSLDFTRRRRKKRSPREKNNGKVNMKYLKLYSDDEDVFDENGNVVLTYNSDGEKSKSRSTSLDRRNINLIKNNNSEVTKTLEYLDNIPKTYITEVAQYIYDNRDAIREKKELPEHKLIIHNVFFMFILKKLVHKVEIRNQYNQLVSIDNVVNLLNDEIDNFRDDIVEELRRRREERKKRKRNQKPRQQQFSFPDIYPDIDDEVQTITNRGEINDIISEMMNKEFSKDTISKFGNESRIIMNSDGSSVSIRTKKKNKRQPSDIPSDTEQNRSRISIFREDSSYDSRREKRNVGGLDVINVKPYSKYKDNSNVGLRNEKGTDTTTLTGAGGVNYSHSDYGRDVKEGKERRKEDTSKDKEKNEIIFEKTNEDFNGTQRTGKGNKITKYKDSDGFGSKKEKINEEDYYTQDNVKRSSNEKNKNIDNYEGVEQPKKKRKHRDKRDSTEKEEDYDEEEVTDNKNEKNIRLVKKPKKDNERRFIEREDSSSEEHYQRNKEDIEKIKRGLEDADHENGDDGVGDNSTRLISKKNRDTLKNKERSKIKYEEPKKYAEQKKRVKIYKRDESSSQAKEESEEISDISKPTPRDTRTQKQRRKKDQREEESVEEESVTVKGEKKKRKARKKKVTEEEESEDESVPTSKRTKKKKSKSKKKKKRSSNKKGTVSSEKTETEKESGEVEEEESEGEEEEEDYDEDEEEHDDEEGGDVQDEDEDEGEEDGEEEDGGKKKRSKKKRKGKGKSKVRVPKLPLNTLQEKTSEDESSEEEVIETKEGKVVKKSQKISSKESKDSKEALKRKRKSRKSSSKEVSLEESKEYMKKQRKSRKSSTKDVIEESKDSKEQRRKSRRASIKEKSEDTTKKKERKSIVKRKKENEPNQKGTIPEDQNESFYTSKRRDKKDIGVTEDNEVLSNISDKEDKRTLENAERLQKMKKEKEEKARAEEKRKRTQKFEQEKEENEKLIKEFIEDKKKKELTAKDPQSNPPQSSKEHNDILKKLLLRNNPNFFEQLQYKEPVAEKGKVVEEEKKKDEVESKRPSRMSLGMTRERKKQSLVYDNSYLFDKEERKNIPNPFGKEKEDSGGYSLMRSDAGILSSDRSSRDENKKVSFKKKAPFVNPRKMLKTKTIKKKKEYNNFFQEQLELAKKNLKKKEKKPEEEEEELNEKARKERYDQMLKDFFAKIQALREANKGDLEEEMDKLIDKQIETSDYAILRQKEYRMNTFLRELEIFRKKKKIYRKLRGDQLRFKTPLDFFLDNEEKVKSDDEAQKV